MDPFDPKDYTFGPSMYTVTEQYIKPVTAAAGNVSWASQLTKMGFIFRGVRIRGFQVSLVKGCECQGRK